MAEHVRDALLAEARRALELVHLEDAASLFAELERWTPEDGELARGSVSRPAGEVIDAAVGALIAAFPDRGAELAAAVLARTRPWRVLAETTLWCEKNWAANALRTPAFLPNPPLPGGPGVDWFLWANDPKRVQQLEAITLHRRRALENQRPQPAVPAGRFLVYWPDEQMSDGASQRVSDGFFDIFDAAPWDTWLHYEPVHHFLVSWVPDRLAKRVDGVVQRNPIACHAWLDELIGSADHPRHSLRFAFAPWLRALALRPWP